MQIKHCIGENQIKIGNPYINASLMKEFLNCKVIGIRYAIIANCWFAGWLQEETYSSPRKYRRAELAAKGTF